jgi:4'-phosphopantetheinyl transferase
MVDSDLIAQVIPNDFSCEADVSEHGIVDIWTAALDVSPALQARFQCVLSADELDRAERFHFASHRHRYISARGFLRTVLSEYVQMPPSELEFEYGLHGKPTLLSSFDADTVHFNLSHSGGIAVLAVTRTAPVGVDVEQVKELKEFDELVNRFFSVREASRFSRLPKDEKAAAFFNLWTRKEAWLKATGEGIAHRLRDVEVTFLANEPARFLALPADKLESVAGHSSWQLFDFSPVRGCKAALAIAASEIQIQNRSWTHSMASEGRNTFGNYESNPR